jgi:hypothetical protein
MESSGRIGRRWTELGGEGSLGLTRSERTRKAAATRRAAARASVGG